ncbi:hypothetical protein BJ912DRAFT_27174 [Pholiota molesta]|nr:hypothetical protein BJ912DRAFT_27174 [Pholiota molesta]
MVHGGHSAQIRSSRCGLDDNGAHLRRAGDEGIGRDIAAGQRRECWTYQEASRAVYTDTGAAGARDLDTWTTSAHIAGVDIQIARNHSGRSQAAWTAQVPGKATIPLQYRTQGQHTTRSAVSHDTRTLGCGIDDSGVAATTTVRLARVWGARAASPRAPYRLWSFSAEPRDLYELWTRPCDTRERGGIETRVSNDRLRGGAGRLTGQGTTTRAICAGRRGEYGAESPCRNTSPALA